MTFFEAWQKAESTEEVKYTYGDGSTLTIKRDSCLLNRCVYMSVLFKKEWTIEGIAYLNKLRTLSGVARRRFLDGVWCSAEGQVYDSFEPTIHIISAKKAIKDEDIEFIRDQYLPLKMELENILGRNLDSMKYGMG